MARLFHCWSAYEPDATASPLSAGSAGTGNIAQQATLKSRQPGKGHRKGVAECVDASPV